MTEIITIHIGQCGNQIGSQFWELLAYEHGLNEFGMFEGRSDLQLHKINVYFMTGEKKYTPRAILVDMEPTTLDCIVSCSHKNFFSSELVVSGTHGACSNWAKGHLTEGVALVDKTMDLIRKLSENCGRIQGFQLIHSLGGGTGSGLGSLLTNRIKESYSDQIVANFAIFPSAKISDVVLEPYNATLSVQQLMENSDMTFVLDNEALHEVCFKTMKVEEPTYGDLNQLICACMSGITTCLRFPGQLNADLRKLAVNLIPFPTLHFLATSYAPLNPQFNSINVDKNVPNLALQLFNPSNIMASCDVENGKYLATAVIFRGIVSTREVEEEMLHMQNRLKANFVDWLPSNISTAICDIAPPGCSMCATLIVNTTAIKDVFQRLEKKFSSMLNQKAFLHWYKEEGLEENDFKDALTKMQTLIKDYQSQEKKSK